MPNKKAKLVKKTTKPQSLKIDKPIVAKTTSEKVTEARGNHAVRLLIIAALVLIVLWILYSLY